MLTTLNKEFLPAVIVGLYDCGRQTSPFDTGEMTHPVIIALELANGARTVYLRDSLPLREGCVIHRLFCAATGHSHFANEVGPRMKELLGKPILVALQPTATFAALASAKPFPTPPKYSTPRLRLMSENFAGKGGGRRVVGGQLRPVAREQAQAFPDAPKPTRTPRFWSADSGDFSDLPACVLGIVRPDGPVKSKGK